MHESHLQILFVPAVTTGGTGIGAGPLVACLTDIGIQNDVRIPIDVETGYVEDFIKVDIHRALHPL
jgi:hypothetical protein